MNLKIGKTIRDQLTQGVSPEKIAMTLAIGASLAIFPILGATTTLCLIVGIRMKLNHPILQIVNYLLYPLQFLMLPVFVLAGSTLFGHPLTIVPKVIAAEFKVDPSLTLRHYGVAVLEGAVVWCFFAPLIGYGIYRMTLRLIPRLKIWKT